MTIKIARESLPCSPEQFAAALDGYVAALTEYNEHLKGVEADAADPSIPHENKRVAFPPPEPPLGIMTAAIGRRDDGSLYADYEIVGPPLDVRKQRLMQQVSEVEGAELAKVTPPGKARYWQMREQAIRQADSEVMTAHMSAGNDLPGDAEAFLRSMRSSADTDFLAEQDARRKEEDAVRFWAAKQHHDIEDLTEETVDGWKMEAFRG